MCELYSVVTLAQFTPNTNKIRRSVYYRVKWNFIYKLLTRRGSGSRNYQTFILYMNRVLSVWHNSLNIASPVVSQNRPRSDVPLCVCPSHREHLNSIPHPHLSIPHVVSVCEHDTLRSVMASHPETRAKCIAAELENKRRNDIFYMTDRPCCDGSLLRGYNSSLSTVLFRSVGTGTPVPVDSAVLMVVGTCRLT